jgi:hypothetical protein
MGSTHDAATRAFGYCDNAIAANKSRATARL